MNQGRFRRCRKTVLTPAKANRNLADSRGFSLLQMLIVVAIVAIVVGFSVFGIRSARAAQRLQTSARVFAQTVEKARLDAIRRHDSTRVEFTDASTYEVTMDFAGNGTNQTRTFTLETGVTVTGDNGATLAAADYPYAIFDWRGRLNINECNTLFRMRNERSDQLTVQVAGSGDITVNNAVTNMPTVTYTTVSSTADVVPTATLTGGDTHLNLSPCGVSGGGGGGGGGGTTPPPPTVTCTAGTMTLSTAYVQVSRNGGSTQTVNITVNAPGTINASPDSNLRVTPSTQTFSSSSGGTATFTVASINKNKGTYSVKFNFATCTPATLYVKVVN